MAFALYLLTAALALFAIHRWVTRLSRRAAMVLLLVPLPFVGQALLTDRVYGGHDMIFLSQPWSDYKTELGVPLPYNWYLLDQALALAPWQQAVRDAWSRGEWPLWNPTVNSGDILAASMQAAPYNPINLIGLLLPLALSITFGAAMIFFLAAALTYAYARELGCGEAPSLVAALGFAFSAGVVFWVGWTPLSSWVLLPLVLLGIRRASFPILTAAFALLILFGHPETMLHVVAIGGAYALFERRGMARAIAAGVVAVCLTAIFLLPFLEVIDQTWQYDLFREQAANPAPASAHAIARAAGATFIPYYGGATFHNLTREWDFGTARVGSVILALAICAAMRFWRRREVRFFLALAAVALVASFGVPILRKVPLFAIAKNERLGFAAAFALSILAAIGVEAITRRAVLVLATIVLVTTAALWPLRAAFGVEPKMMVLGLAAELIGLAALLWNRRFGVVLAVLAAQRVAEDGFIYPALPRRQFYPQVPILARIPRDPMYRVTATANLLIPNAGAMAGLDDVRGYVSMTLRDYKRTTALWCPAAQRSYHEVTDLTLPFLSFLGVRHAIVTTSMEPPPGWRVVADDRETRVLENSRAVPRVFIPRSVRFIDDDETAMTEMTAATDFAAQAWVHTGDEPARLAGNGQAELRARRDGSRYEIEVDALAPTRIIVTETNWPGWRASLDGRRVKLQRANLAFLSLPIPPGKHRVHLVYLPGSFVWGRAISFATIIALVLTALRRRLP